ncbi:MAG: Mu-like prophage major head subunit gpT family protein [Fimbriimonadaceae bacterium]|nr:Mu-like prophage major head subunit gpT family protein [Fimbriimonadaceae bacterium]QYK55492.1 MAG: Mu-like prophage major head subunit gpT family protein [Fimbriimonadaceae bacterium]
MALTKSDVPNLLLPGLKTEFEQAYRSKVEDSIANQIATVVSTTLPVQKYAWLGATPPMREFLDERRPQGMGEFSVTIEDKVFESTIAVDRRAIEDDQLDLIRLRVRELANRVGMHRHQIVVQALLNGATGTGYDGATFFSATHPGYSGATYSNTTNSALSAATLATAMSSMMTLPDDSGTPLGIVPDTLLVGPKLMWDAIELIESQVVVYKATGAAGTSPTPYLNAFSGRLKLIVSPYVSGTGADAWFLMDTSRPIKGILLQQRSDVPVEFTALESTTGSESAFMQDRYYYGVRARYNVGYGLWQAVYGGKLS